MIKRWLRSFLAAVAVAVLVAYFHLFSFRSGWGEGLEGLSLDYRFIFRGPMDPPSQFVVVAIDEQSYGNLEIPMSSAWPRGVHADLMERLIEYGVKKVVFDILFLDPGEYPQDDAALAVQFSRIPSVIGAESAIREVQTPQGSYESEEFLEPYDLFLEHASAALVGLPEDNGTIRRFLTERNDHTMDLLSLAEAAVGPERLAQSYPGERDLINYYGPADTMPTISYYQLLDEYQPWLRELLAEKTAFVGLMLRTGIGPTQKDSFRGPFKGRHLFGVEIHATAAANLFEQSWIRRCSTQVEEIGLSLAAGVAGAAVVLLAPLWGGLILLIFGTAWLISSYLLFLSGWYVPGAVLFIVVLPVFYLLNTLYCYVVTRRVQRKIQRAFELYLSPEMARRVAKSSSTVSLGGEKVVATVLFTDIEGFTVISETMPAESVSAMLNSYFTQIMEVVFENQGTLLKFIGDAVFLLWGAPLPLEDHADRAVATALALQREVQRFNATGKFPPLPTRIGVHTGPMVVGNLGSKRRMDYTAIGDAVNLAARIEAINKYFGTYTLITGDVYSNLTTPYPTLELGSVKVVGKKEIVLLYGLFEPFPTAALAADWREALKAFRAGAWDEAERLFRSTASHELRLAKASELYQSEITRYRESSPGPDWQGEITFHTK